MVDGLKISNGGIFHQSLHGYEDGHRQLALSAPLTTRDRKTLLALSDLAGPGLRMGPDGYLTGYPLAESGMYALARTWAAPEMPRPGCVWTHTLLIDFADLAQMSSLLPLLWQFRHPAGEVRSRYAEPIMVSWADDSMSTRHGLAPIEWTRNLVAALYGAPKDKIVSFRNNPAADDAVVSIWSQQWPRLRRNFRFCTLTLSDRSFDKERFDLQLVAPSERNSRSRFADFVEAEQVGEKIHEDWLDEALDDLERQSPTGLRAFLRKVGGDSPTGRESFRPLCLIYGAITSGGRSPGDLNRAIDILEAYGRNAGLMSARIEVADAAMRQVETLSEQGINFLVSVWNEIPLNNSPLQALRVGREIWRRAPQQLLSWIGQGNPLSDMARITLDALTIDQLLQGLSIYDDGLDQIVGQRPDLLESAEFWSAVHEVERIAVPDHILQERGDAIALSAINSERQDLVKPLTGWLGSSRILHAVNSLTSSSPVDLWLAEAAVDANAVASFLTHAQPIRRSVLWRLSQSLHPNAMPNDLGDDPWLHAYLNATDSLSPDLEDGLASYILARAFGPSTRTPCSLIWATFERVYIALLTQALPVQAWQLLESRLPWVTFTWNRQDWLLASVSHLFVERACNPELFAGLSSDGEVFAALCKETLKRYDGKSYLKEVRTFLESPSNIPTENSTTKLKILTKALR